MENQTEFKYWKSKKNQIGTSNRIQKLEKKLKNPENQTVSFGLYWIFNVVCTRLYAETTKVRTNAMSRFRRN